MTEAVVPPHPAKFSDSILAVLRRVLREEAERALRPLMVLDPMAGVGRVHELAVPNLIATYGVELEPEWAAAHQRTEVGDARHLSYPDGMFSAVVTSPCYGNRMADHHDAKDASRRHGYRFALGRMPSEGSGATLAWGSAYRELHLAVLREMRRVVRPGGLVVVNVSNHLRTVRDVQEEQLVAEWWLANMLALGLRLEEAVPVSTPRMRFGENHRARVEREWVFVTRRRP